MKALSISEFIELKNTAEKEYGIELHLHDTCGAQYISAKEIFSNEFTNYLKKFIMSKRLGLTINDDKHSFTVKEK